MQYTTHFNLMLPEGTDIVNPLVQQNPNFSDIDAAMFANKQGSVGSATELTAGTVHTITRANADSDIIKFTATSNWTAGDTMIIDSTPVSVFLSDGTTPATGAYVINTEVFLIVSGSRATLIISAGAPDADLVGYDHAASGLTASNVQDAIDEVVDNDINGVVLATVTADGINTYETVLNGLFALLDASKLTRKSVLQIGGEVDNIVTITGGIRFASSALVMSATWAEERAYTINANGSLYLGVAFVNNTSTVYNRSATIPPAGTKFTIYR